MSKDLNLPVYAGMDTSAMDRSQEMPQSGYSSRISLKIPNVTRRPASSASWDFMPLPKELRTMVPHCNRAGYTHTHTHYILAYMASRSLRITSQLPVSDNTSERHSRTNVHMTISVSSPLGTERETPWEYMVPAPHLDVCITAVRRVHSTLIS